MVRGISLFLDQLGAVCPALRSVWMIGQRANGEAMDSAGPFGWDLIAFADTQTLQRLRKADYLHRQDVQLRIVTDGDRFELAWGANHASGSLGQWEWREAARGEAFYFEAHWATPVHSGNIERTRRKAVCLWRCGDPSYA
jgi:hypothetical protein